jgi:hypothetical protein
LKLGEELIGIWRKMHNQEIHNLYSSPDIIRVVKSRSMRRVGHAVSMRRKIKENKRKTKGKNTTWQT